MLCSYVPSGSVRAVKPIGDRRKGQKWGFRRGKCVVLETLHLSSRRSAKYIWIKVASTCSDICASQLREAGDASTVFGVSRGSEWDSGEELDFPVDGMLK